MIKTITWFAYLSLYFIYSITFMCKIKYYELTGQANKAKDYRANRIRSWAKDLVEQTGSDVKVSGVENIPDEPVLFVSNHQSAFDILLLLGYLPHPKAFIAKWSLRYVPIMSSWMKRMNCIFIKRDDFRQTLTAFKNAGRVFKAGSSLVIFPEGTRSKSGKLNKFKKGSFKIALREEVAIVPVTIKDSNQVWEGNGGMITAADLELVVHKPVYPSTLKQDELMNKVRDSIATSLN